MKNERIKLILEQLNQDIKGLSNVHQAATKKIVKKLVKTISMDPFNNPTDATHVKKVLAKCKLIAIETDLSKANKNILSILDFLGDVIDMDDRSNLISDLIKIRPGESKTSSESQKDDLKKKIFSMLDDIQTKVEKEILKLEDEESLPEPEQPVSLKKDFECDLAELPSNYKNGEISKMSGVRISKLMEIKFIKNEKDSVSLTATNLPSEISKKEFKKLIKHTNLWLDKKTILEIGDQCMKCRIMYSNSYITMLLVNKNVIVKTDKNDINQKIVMVQKETVNGKSKLKIADFFNSANLKVKDVIKVKEMRKFLKKVTFDKSINLIDDQYCIDNQDNFYQIGLPLVRN